MQYFSVGNLDLIFGGLPVPGFTLMQPVQGLEGAPRRTNAYSKPGAHGSIISTQFYDGRQITLTGTISGTDYADYLANRQAFISATAINLDSNNYPVRTQISYTMLDGSEYFLQVIFDKPMMDLTSATRCDFQVTGTASDSLIYSNNFNSNTVNLPTGGGYVVPMIVPYTSAGSTGGSVIMTNQGTETTMPKVYLWGPLTNPVITNLATGSYFQLNYTIGPSDFVVIDMASRTVALNNSSSLIGTKTSTSDWWGIISEDNTVTLTSGSASDTGHAEVKYYPAYGGT